MSVGFWVAVILAVMHGAAMFVVWLVTRKKRETTPPTETMARVVHAEPKADNVANGTVLLKLALVVGEGAPREVVWEVEAGHVADLAAGREVAVRVAELVEPAVPFAAVSELHTRLWARAG